MKGAIYAGYSKNLGTTKDLYNFGTEENAKYYTYYKGKNGGNGIDQHWRICPSITYNLKHLNFGVQYELTAADYGTMERDGKVSDTHTVYNHRVCGMVKYNF